MARPHAALRGALVARDIDQKYLCSKLLQGRTYVSERMMGHKPWTLDECYTILALIGAPASDLPHYFPPRGVA